MRRLGYTRRALGVGAAALTASAFAPEGLRLSTTTKRDLWRRSNETQLRGAVFVQRRVYPDLDGPSFLGAGPIGPPITDDALSSLADAGANLASWSGPGLFNEAGDYTLDPQVEDHIGDWLDRCLALGLYTTLCFRSGPGRSAFAFHPEEDWYPAKLYDANLWSSVERQAAWIEMVVQTLRGFGDHRALAGIIPMEEPNGVDLGFDSVWPNMARQLQARVRAEGLQTKAPLIYSPERWASAEEAANLRGTIGDEAVLAIHDYTPWNYTHQSPNEPLRYNARRMALSDLSEPTGDWSVLEFGAVRYAPGAADFLMDRIAAWEAAGANWAAFRWTTGWRDYERAEGSMTIPQDSGMMAALRAAFQRNHHRP